MSKIHEFVHKFKNGTEIRLKFDLSQDMPYCESNLKLDMQPVELRQFITSNDFMNPIVDERENLRNAVLAAATLTRLQESLSPSKRKEIWEIIMDGYCRECGNEDRSGQCHCENDE